MVEFDISQITKLGYKTIELVCLLIIDKQTSVGNIYFSNNLMNISKTFF